jgi:hypothetical protein
LGFQTAMYFGFNGFPQRLGASCCNIWPIQLMWGWNK